MALVEGAELARLAGLFHGLLGSDPKKRLGVLLKKEVAEGLPEFGTLDGSDGPFIDWLASLDEAKLASVLELLPDNPVVTAVHDRLADTHDDEEPWHRLGGRMVVLGRPRLRDQLPELIEGSRRVALIYGERYTGKTFTKEILQGKTRRKSSAIEVIYIDVQQAQSARRIAREAVLRLGGDSTRVPPNDEAAPGDRVPTTLKWWIDQLAEWIAVEALRDRERQRWLVFDGYARVHEVHEDPDVTQLLGRLAVRAVEHVDEPNGFRVVFVDHPDLLPPRAHDFHIREEIERITDLDVLDVLTKHFPTKKPEELHPIVKDVTAGTEDVGTRLPLLQQRLAKIIFTDS
jgi:hypothetical protein